MSHDLIVTNAVGEKHSYVLAVGEQNPLVHTASAPNIQINSARSSPVQAGGLYDIRDTEGSKALTHLDWVKGEGQKTLDAEDSSSARYQSSSYMDVSVKGQLKLLCPKTDTALVNTSGPVYVACGYVWLGGQYGTLKYSSDEGATWLDATIGGTAPTAPIGGFTTDGTRVFFCVPSGASKGIWANTAAVPGTFAKYGATGTTEEIRHLAYNGGLLYAATASGAGTVNCTGGNPTGVYTQVTPDFLNITNTSIKLVSSGNSILWVVSQGGRSFVYKIYLDPATSVYHTEQYAEFPTGFVATCAVGYLSNTDVGGYYESRVAGVGKGAVYRVNESEIALLFEIGETPENTFQPYATENDNRIYAACSGSKDEFFLTNRACYRWDINDSGYSHVFDHLGAGASEMVTTWNAGSYYSWDGTNQNNVAPSYQFPAGFSAVETFPYGTGTTPGTWSYVDGVAVYTGAGTTVFPRMTLTGHPHDNGETLSNSGGTTFEVKFKGTSCISSFAASLLSYPIPLNYKEPGFTVIINDGTRQMKAGVRGQFPDHPTLTSRNDITVELWQWNGTAWVYLSKVISPAAAVNTVTFTLRGVTATARIDSSAVLTTNLTKADTDHDGIVIKWDASPPTYTDMPKYAVDSWTLNSVAAQPSSVTYDTTFRPSLAYNKGKLIAPYAPASSAEDLTITSSSVSSPTSITTSAAHGLTTGQVVNITGHTGSVPPLSGNYIATTTAYANQFTIPVAVGTGGTGGHVTYNPSVGWTTQGEGYTSVGSLRQSATTFHTGSILKKFFYVSVTHDPVAEGCWFDLSYCIDGVVRGCPGVTSGQETRFPMGNVEGYSVDTTLVITRDDTYTVSPIIHSINIVWDFVKTKKHQYLLDCRTGASGGRWDEDSEEAITFLFATSDEVATFEDRFIGSYEGTVEEVQFAQASYSPKEGYGGLVRVTVREG